MQLIRFSNIKFSDLASRLEKYFGSNFVSSGIIKCVMFRSGGDWHIFMAVIKLGFDEFDNVENEDFQYPQYRFVSRKIDNVAVHNLFSDLEQSGELPISGFQNFDIDGTGLNWTEILVPSHVRDNGFPVRQFSARVAGNVNFHEMKLISHNMPFHMSAFDFVKDFLGLKDFHGSNDTRIGEVLIDIVDSRARIEFSDKKVSYRCNYRGKLSLVGKVDGVSIRLNSPINSCDMDFQSASSIELWLVNSSNEVMDYCSSSEWDYRFGLSVDRANERVALNVISKGEGEHCEFKKYIDLSEGKNQKAIEIAKAVCALSNYQGGWLFIGVDDEAVIVGINEGCKKNYKCDVVLGVENYKKDVSKNLKESLCKNQCFEMSEFRSGDIFFLAIMVHKVEGLNYLIQSKEAYIRRGASSVKMSPPEIQASRSERNYLLT